MNLKVESSFGLSSQATIRLKSSNRKVKVPNKLIVRLSGGSGAIKTFVLKASKKAKGKTTITATTGRLKSTAVYKIKKR